MQREFPFTHEDFDYLRQMSNARTGIVVGDDKFDMFYSRLAKRVRALQLPDFSAYCRYLRESRDDQETTRLVNAITTNLTAFFRESHHFEYLREHALPERLRVSIPGERLRVWSAGCSTGEEPYSLGMVLGEMRPMLRATEVELFATDIDTEVLETASHGIYQLDRVNGISQDRLHRWFYRGTGAQQGRVRIKPALRQKVTFGLCNLVQPWQQEPQDIIFCRNVIIYFDQNTRAALVERFADALKPGGYLFLGHSESLLHLSDRFELIGKTVYRRLP